MVIVHAQVNQAPKMRRRTYRAHGRINRMYFLIHLQPTTGYFIVICSVIVAIMAVSDVTVIVKMMFLIMCSLFEKTMPH